MRHTPGPWTLAANKSGAYVTTHTSNPLFYCRPASAQGCEAWDANARLIAAAPELLAALKLALPILGMEELVTVLALHPDETNAIVDAAMAALAKAEAQP